MTGFEEAYQLVRVHEGGVSNHKADPGKLTKWGVTQSTYDNYRQRWGLTKQPVTKMSEDECRTIYHDGYWLPIKGAQLPWALAYVLFDGAINSGAGQSIKWLQRALGVRVDGVMGPITVHAARSFADLDLLINKVLDRRLVFLKALKTFKTFGKGWTRRVAEVREVALRGADVVTPAQDVTVKPVATDAKSAPSTAPGDMAIGTGALSAVIAQLNEQLAEFTNIELVAKIVVALTITGALVTVAGIVHRTWAKHKAAKLADALDLVPA